MKDHPQRKGRLQLIEAMFAGHSWQEALAQSQLHVSRASAYRLRQLASRRVQSERHSRFDAAVSVSQIKRIRAKLGVSNPWRGRTQVPGKNP